MQPVPKTNMHLFALILGIWLLPQGDTLTCFECTQIDSRCEAIQTECPPENYQCGVSRVIAFQGGSKLLDLNVKGCVLNEECGEGSGNSGYFNISVNTLCCNSNLCNTQSVPEPSKKPPNGRQCFTCDGPACNKTLDCVGNEDYCGSGTVDVGATYTINGCISKKLCSALNGYLSKLLQTKITCAKGNFCNSAVTANTGLQLVVLALVSLTLFS